MQSGDALHERPMAGGIGQRVSFVGLVLLCASFFLPCSEIYAPLIVHKGPGQGMCVHYSPDTITQSESGISPAAVAFLEGHAIRYFTSGGLPFVFGYVVACLYLLRHFARREAFARFLAAARTWTCAAFLLAGTVVMCRGLLAIAGQISEMAYMHGACDDPDSLGQVVPHGALAAIIAAVFGMALGCGAILFSRQRMRGPLGMFFCGVTFMPFYGHYLFEYFCMAYFGPLVSALACLLIAGGGAWEAVAVARSQKLRAQPDRANG